MIKIVLPVVMVVCMLLGCCVVKSDHKSLRDGDILFRGNNKLGLSQAINEVTRTSKHSNYTHMGVCHIVQDTVYVFHASPDKGVCREKLADFCHPDGDTTFITDAFRLKKEYRHALPTAFEKAIALIGEPYDYTYILDSEGYYCSEFIYTIFEQDSIFTLNPMTFKNPATGEFHKGWVDHYGGLGIQIPEGKLGCNPNEMATEPTIDFVRRL